MGIQLPPKKGHSTHALLSPCLLWPNGCPSQLMCMPRNTCFLGPIQVHNPNGNSIGSAIFAQLTAECNRACPGTSFPRQMAIHFGQSGPTFNTWFHGPTEVQSSNGIVIGSVIFAGLTTVTDRPTDHSTRCKNRPHLLHSTTMRPKNQPLMTFFPEHTVHTV